MLGRLVHIARWEPPHNTAPFTGIGGVIELDIKADIHIWGADVVLLAGKISSAGLLIKLICYLVADYPILGRVRRIPHSPNIRRVVL